LRRIWRDGGCLGGSKRDLGLRNLGLGHLGIFLVGSIFFLNGGTVLGRSREEDTGLDGAASERLGPLQNVWVGC
jgi:hypothetical protein